MGKDPSANRRFVKLCKQFILVSHDSKDGNDQRTELSRRLSVTSPYFLVFGVYEGELERLKLSRTKEFDEVTVNHLKKMEQNYIHGFRKQLGEYIATYRTADEGLRTEIDSLTRKLGSEHFQIRRTATRKLTEFGEPAALLMEKKIKQNNINDAEIKTRICKILEKHRPQRVLINRKGLDHNVVFLSKGVATVPAMRNRLQKILPKGISVESAELWWKENGQRYHWDGVTQQFRLK